MRENSPKMMKFCANGGILLSREVIFDAK